MDITPESVYLYGGTRRAIHVFTPALQHRLTTKNCLLPVMAVREAPLYNMLRLFQRVEILGPSSLDPLFHDPLPGTNGRGVAILFTEAPLLVWRLPHESCLEIDSHDGRDPAAVLRDVIAGYLPKCRSRSGRLASRAVPG